jgi:hypothetical protein
MFSKKMYAGLLAVCGALLGLAVCNPAYAAEYYVQPVKGVDTNAGSKDAPWKTVKYALSNASPLKAGDTLYLRGGIYHETAIWCRKKGAEGQPITIANAPGESAVLYGSDPDYETVPNQQWEIHDASKGIYKSVKTWDAAPSGALYSTSGTYYGLIRYKNYDWLASDDEYYSNKQGFYAGPGIFYNLEDKKLYIRLKHPKADVYDKDLKLTNDLDPSKVALFIPTRVAPFPYPVSGINLDYAKYINITGLKFFAYGANAIEAWNECENLNFKDIVVDSAFGAIRLRQGKHVLVENLKQTGLIAPYIAWNDTKSGQAVALSLTEADGVEVLSAEDLVIRNCLFNGSFDAVRLAAIPSYKTENVRIYNNTFRDVHDDSVSLETGVVDLDIHHNRFLNVSKGVSRVGGDDATDAVIGRVFIHHNIIDIGMTYQTRRMSPEIPPLYNSHAVFGTHGIGEGTARQPWKIYNNTILIGAPIANGNGLGHEYTGYHTDLFDPAKPEAYDRNQAHEVYNNIFIIKGDWHFGRNAHVATGEEIYDGNIYFKTKPAEKPANFFSPLYESNAKPNPRIFPSLAAFKADPWFALSQKYYAPGWEALGMEGDPKINADYTPIADGPASKPGVDLSTRNWPDANDTNYRGAIAPK